MSFAIGDRIGDYRIDGVLGRGGMGRVFRVRNLISDRPEAMKVLLPDFEENPDLGERFLREIRLLAALDHPNIAALHTALRAGNRLVMVMELVEGASLEERLRGGAIPPREAREYAAQVLAALDYAHRKGIVHRDIKPANIIVAPSGQVKLTDFGIARAAGDLRHTSTGMAVGSVPYMSPEQIQAGEIDGRSDLYSLGITLYEMVSGRRPFEGENEYAIMNAHLNQTPAPPPEFAGVILKAMAKDPAGRFQTAQEFQAALRQPGSSSSPGLWEPALLDAARELLASWAGPIAKVMVARAARKAQSVEELRVALAAEIPSEPDRKAFLAAFPGLKGN